MRIKTNYDKELAERVLSGEVEGEFYVQNMERRWGVKVLSTEAPGNHPLVVSWSDDDRITKIFGFCDTGYSPKDGGTRVMIECDLEDIFKEGDYGTMTFKTGSGKDDLRVVYFLSDGDLGAHVGIEGMKVAPISSRRVFHGKIDMSTGTLAGAFHMDEAKKYMFNNILKAKQGSI